MGSNPVRVTILFYAYLAQSVEHAAVNRRVVGSSPTIGAIELVLIAARVHPFPYRTRKLSSLALKILGGKLPGKISRCQHYNKALGTQELCLYLCAMFCIVII